MNLKVACAQLQLGLQLCIFTSDSGSCRAPHLCFTTMFHTSRARSLEFKRFSRYSATNWLSSSIPRKEPLFPQIEDHVVYIKLAHEQYAIKNRFSHPLQNVPAEQVLGKISSIVYERKRTTGQLCCVTLDLENENGVLTGESFIFKYRDIDQELDFLVLRQHYELSIRRCAELRPGDRFRTIIDDKWWEGTFLQVLPFEESRPQSTFLSCRFHFQDKDTYERLSPWELEPMGLDGGAGSGVPVLPAEFVALYQPQPGDWPEGNRDSECDRISSGLSQVMSLAIAKLFAAPVDPNHPIVEYPIDLSTIKARLDNRFYRRLAAVQFDVRYILTNACKLHQPKSNEIRFAKIVTDLCLQIISNRCCVSNAVFKAIYQELLEKYKLCDEGADENGGGPSTSKTGAKWNEAASSSTNTRSRRLRNSQHANSDSEAKAGTSSNEVEIIYPAPAKKQKMD